MLGKIALKVGFFIADIGLYLVRWGTKKSTSKLVEKLTDSKIFEDRSKVLVHEVLKGPLHKSEHPELESLYMPPSAEYYLVVKAERDGEISTINLWYETEENAQLVANHFKTSIEPLELLL